MAQKHTFSDFHRAILDAGATKASSYTHRMHHSGAAEENIWDAQKSEFYNLSIMERRCGLALFAEVNQRSKQRRIILFGRELLGKRKATTNTARLTFNSDNQTSEGFFVKPNLKPVHKRALTILLGGRRRFPRFRDGRIELGGGSPAQVLDRFLEALVQVEDVKNIPLEELERRYPEGETFSIADIQAVQFEEGQLSTVSRNVRRRSARLRQLAVDHFKAKSPDGRLRCFVDGWRPQIDVRREVVQIHHDEALSQFPEDGDSRSFEEAILTLFPLCPNCHSILHSKPSGGNYTIPELKSLMRGKLAFKRQARYGIPALDN